MVGFSPEYKAVIPGRQRGDQKIVTAFHGGHTCTEETVPTNSDNSTRTHEIKAYVPLDRLQKQGKQQAPGKAHWCLNNKSISKSAGLLQYRHGRAKAKHGHVEATEEPSDQQKNPKCVSSISLLSAIMKRTELGWARQN